MLYNDPQLFYENGSKVDCVISSYTPPLPVIKVIKNKPLKGNTHFQVIKGKNDTQIKFSAVFNIKECGKSAYQKFLNHYYDLFTFTNEDGISYTGMMDGNLSNDMPIEGDIYYVGVTLICNCEVSGL